MKVRNNFLHVAMVSRRYGVEEALEAILDDDFGLSDGPKSEEEGEDIYAYVGVPTLPRGDVEAIGFSVADDQPPSSDSNSAEGAEEELERSDDDKRHASDPLGGTSSGTSTSRYTPSVLTSFAGRWRASDDEGELSGEADSAENDSESEIGSESGIESDSASDGRSTLPRRGRGRAARHGRTSRAASARGRSTHCTAPRVASGSGRSGSCGGHRSTSGKSRSGETLDDVPDTWKKEESTALRTIFKITPGPVLFVIITYLGDLYTKLLTLVLTNTLTKFYNDFMTNFL